MFEKLLKQRICNVRLCDKSSCINPQRSLERAGGGHQVIPACSFSQSQRKSHQPLKGPSAEAQRSTGAQWQGETQIKDSEEGTPCVGPSQGCPRRPSDLLSRCGTHQDESMVEHPLDWRGLLPEGMGHIMGWRGGFGDCRVFIGYLGIKGRERHNCKLWCDVTARFSYAHSVQLNNMHVSSRAYLLLM